MSRLDSLAARDQEDRVGLSVETMQDTAFGRRLLVADSSRTSAVLTLMASKEWPPLSDLPDSAVSSFFLLVQHSASLDLKVEALSLLEPLVSAGRFSGQEYALLFDRARTEQGYPQRFGTQFELSGEDLVPEPVEDLEALDSLRIEIGLPPIEVYIDALTDLYNAEVQWPPPDTIPGPRR